MHDKRGLDSGDCVGKARPILVIPAQAGIQGLQAPSQQSWIPAFAGMTELGFLF